MVALLGGVFLGTFGIIVVSGFFLQAELLPLLPEIEQNQALITVVVESSVAGFVLAIAMLIFVFFMVGRFIARPIRVITNAMRTFSETGTKQPLPHSWSPKEVRTLERAFDSLTLKVEKVHKHDAEISRMKSDFISTAAHQLRTPLTGIRWALEALQAEQLTDNQKTLVASAVEKSHQLVSVVGTLLDITSIESGKYKYDMKKVALDTIVAEVTRDLSEHATKSQIALFFEKSGAGSPSVLVDRERIRWVLTNLVENAIRYTPAGGTVRVTTEVAPERAYVRVRDTGIGIPEQDRGNIFQRFYRASNAVTKENGGNGLGLYIARTIATDHGGDLNFAANENGAGTTFTLSLPLAS